MTASTLPPNRGGSQPAQKITDEELRLSLAEGLSPVQIATLHGVSRQTVNRRMHALGAASASAVVQPVEAQRHVGSTVDVLEQLALNLKRGNLLQTACHEWLKDPDQAQERYLLGPRGEEVDIVYLVEIPTERGFRTERRKKKFSALAKCLAGEDEDGARFAGVVHGETKHADVRELILRTQAEARLTCQLYSDLIQRLIDFRILDDWRRAVIEEIAKENPEVASRIAQRLERSIVMHAAFAGSIDPTQGRR